MEEEREEEERLTELASTLSLDSSDIPEVEDGGGDKGKSPENAENGGVQDREEQTTQGAVQSNGEKEAAQVTEERTQALCACACMYIHVYMCTCVLSLYSGACMTHTLMLLYVRMYLQVLTEGEDEAVPEQTGQAGDSDGGGCEENADSGGKAEGGSEEGGKGEEESGGSKPETADSKDGVEKTEEVNVMGVGEPRSEEVKEGQVEQKQEGEHASKDDSNRSEEDGSCLEAKRGSVNGRMSLLPEEPEEGVSEVTLLVIGEDGQPPGYIRDLQSRAMSISKSRRLSGEPHTTAD